MVNINTVSVNLNKNSRKNKMQKLFQFESRYNQLRTVYKNGYDEYLIEGESAFYRVGEEFVDLQGGPFVAKDTDLELFGIKDERKVDSIKIEEGESPNFYRIRIKMV